MMRKARQAVERFFLKPSSPLPLAALRVAIAACLLLQCYLLRDSAMDFLGRGGFVQQELATVLRPPGTPNIGWLVDHMATFGLEERTVILGFCWSYILALVAMLIGWHTRVAVALVWFTHWTLMNSSDWTVYGVDLYTHVFLFYLLLSPCGATWSLDAQAGRTLATPSSWATLSRRVMQLQLCLTYLASGLEKAQGPQWWNGELLWRALSLPVYHQFDLTWLAYAPWLSKLSGWTTLAFETLYCVLIWPRATRWVWIIGIVALHVGIAVFLGLTMFGLVMALLTPTLFGIEMLIRPAVRKPAPAVA